MSGGSRDRLHARRALHRLVAADQTHAVVSPPQETKASSLGSRISGLAHAIAKAVVESPIVLTGLASRRPVPVYSAVHPDYRRSTSEPRSRKSQHVTQPEKEPAEKKVLSPEASLRSPPAPAKRNLPARDRKRSRTISSWAHTRATELHSGTIPPRHVAQELYNYGRDPATTLSRARDLHHVLTTHFTGESHSTTLRVLGRAFGEICAPEHHRLKWWLHNALGLTQVNPDEMVQEITHTESGKLRPLTEIRDNLARVAGTMRKDYSQEEAVAALKGLAEQLAQALSPEVFGTIADLILPWAEPLTSEERASSRDKILSMLATESSPSVVARTTLGRHGVAYAPLGRVQFHAQYHLLRETVYEKMPAAEAEAFMAAVNVQLQTHAQAGHQAPGLEEAVADVVGNVVLMPDAILAEMIQDLSQGKPSVGKAIDTAESRAAQSLTHTRLVPGGAGTARLSPTLLDRQLSALQHVAARHPHGALVLKKLGTALIKNLMQGRASPGAMAVLQKYTDRWGAPALPT